MKAKIITSIPGPKSKKFLIYNKRVNGGWNMPHPFVYSGEGKGCYFKDLDGNVFLDFVSNVASTPLGYNHAKIKEVVRDCARNVPVKYAGQDFILKEHNRMLEELIGISPAGFNSAFLINSGAEAVENAIKICMRKRKSAKFCVSFENAFHGRTLGALSLTNTKRVHKENYFSIPVRRLPYNEEAGNVLLGLIDRGVSSREIACVIMEPVQGEGGYNIPSKKMVKEVRKITEQKGIPLISDEIQSGMGRTGEMWGIQNFRVKPDVIVAAKALQVGATIANKKMFPDKVGSLSSTWGGGGVIDLAVGVEIIKIVKRKSMLNRIKRMGKYLRKQLVEIGVDGGIFNPRGLGLMCAFDVKNKKMRDRLIIEAAKNGLVILGCGNRGIRLIPPYIINKNEIDEGLEIIRKAVKKC